MGNVQMMIKYKCCLPQNNEDVESESDNENNSRQIVNQLHVIETEKTKNILQQLYPVILGNDKLKYLD